MSHIFAFKFALRWGFGLANLALAIVFLSEVAHAGDQYLGRDGYPVGGNDVVSYHSETAPLPGLETITADYNGATWLFATESNRDLFLTDPQRYAPAYDGHCAYAAAHGNKTRTDPSAYRIVDGVLYLNFSPRIQTRWEEDIPGYLERSEANWPGLEPDRAARPSRW